VKKIRVPVKILSLFWVCIFFAACDTTEGGISDTTDYGLGRVFAELQNRVKAVLVENEVVFLDDEESLDMESIAYYQDAYDTINAWCGSSLVPEQGTESYVVDMRFLLTMVDEVNQGKTSYGKMPKYATEQVVDKEAVDVIVGRLWLPSKLFVVLSGGNAISYSVDAGVWHTAGSAVSFPAYGDIAYGAGKFVVVENNLGKSSSIYSSDGHNWFVGSNSNVRISALAFGAGKFVGVNDSYNGYVSDDGVSWRSASILKDSGYAYFSNLIDIVYGNGKFVAIQAGGGKLVATTDGINWTWEGVMPLAEYWSSIVYEDGKFVAVGGGGKIAVSTDGIDWAEVLAGASLDLVDLAYGAGKFVALSSSGRAITSTDGADWTESVVLDDDVARGWNSIAYGDGKFVAVAGHYPAGGETVYGSRIAVSTDGGASWEIPESIENRDYARIMYVENMDG
jgi:hypothetical protein